MKLAHDALLFLKSVTRNKNTTNKDELFAFLVGSMLDYIGTSKINTIVSNHVSANSPNGCEFSFSDGSSVVLCKDGAFWAKVKINRDPQTQKTHEPTFDHLTPAELLRVVDRDNNKQVEALAHRLENLLAKYDDVFFKMVEMDNILNKIKFDRV